MFTALMLVYVTWIFFLAVMSLKRAKEEGTLTRVAYVLGLPVLLAGVALDWLCNVTVFAVLFLDPPGTKGELVTGRLQRYALGAKGLRYSMAYWFDKHLLRHFDPAGWHVKWPDNTPVETN